MVISKFLRPQQRVEQVHHNQRTDEKQDERLYIHEILLLHAIAEPHVSNRSGEKCDGDCDPKNILHVYLLGPTTVLLPRVRWPFAHQFLPVVCGFYSRGPSRRVLFAFPRNVTSPRGTFQSGASNVPIPPTRATNTHRRNVTEPIPAPPLRLS